MRTESRLGKIWNKEEIRPYRVAVPASIILTCLTVLITGGALKDVVIPAIVVTPLVALIVGDTLECKKILQTHI